MKTLESDEIGWAADLMAARREIYVGYSPVFWRPRRGTVAWHAAFLRRQLEAAQNVALRAEHGFIIAEYRDRARLAEGVVDDFAVDTDHAWAEEGRALLLGAWQRLRDCGAGRLRVVTARADIAKVAMLTGCGLRLAEQWWVMPVKPTAAASAPGRISGPGFCGLLGPAPPVYDPGGPVLLADHLECDAEVSVVEHEAAGMGAVLAVLPTPAGDQRENQLAQRGWTVASQWYLGIADEVLSAGSG